MNLIGLATLLEVAAPFAPVIGRALGVPLPSIPPEVIQGMSEKIKTVSGGENKYSLNEAAMLISTINSLSDRDFKMLIGRIISDERFSSLSRDLLSAMILKHQEGK